MGSVSVGCPSLALYFRVKGVAVRVVVEGGKLWGQHMLHSNYYAAASSFRGALCS